MTDRGVSRRAVLRTGAISMVSALAGCSSLLSNGDTSESVKTYIKDPNWRFVYHDTENTGHNPHASGVTSSPEERWRVTIYDDTTSIKLGYGRTPTPAVVNDHLYIGGRTLSAHHRATGERIWTAESRAGVGVHGIACVEQTVFAMLWEAATRTTFIAAYDAMTGKRHWRTQTGDEIWKPPIVVGETVYVQCHYDLVALDATSGTERWRIDTQFPYSGVPAVTAATIYQPDAQVVARNRRRGLLQQVLDQPPQTNWKLTNMDVVVAPVIAQDRVFVAETQPFPRGGDAETLHALTTDGTERWQHDIGMDAASPAVMDGIIYQKSGIFERMVQDEYGDKRHYTARIGSYDAVSGDEHWVRRIADLGDWHIAPIVAGEVLYVALHSNASNKSYLRAFDTDDGSTLWNVQLAAPAYHLAAVDDTLYVTTYDGVLHAFR
jgi:outer membrane protein assembly factor BamB